MGGSRGIPVDHFIGKFLPVGSIESQVAPGADAVPVGVKKCVVGKSANGGAQGYEHREIRKSGGSAVSGQGQVHPEGKGSGIGNHQAVLPGISPAAPPGGGAGGGDGEGLGTHHTGGPTDLPGGGIDRQAGGQAGGGKGTASGKPDGVRQISVLLGKKGGSEWVIQTDRTDQGTEIKVG